MPDVTIRGTDTTLSFPDSMSQAQIASVLDTHPQVQSLRHQGFRKVLAQSQSKNDPYGDPANDNTAVTNPPLNVAPRKSQLNNSLAARARELGLPTQTDANGKVNLAPQVRQMGITRSAADAQQSQQDALDRAQLANAQRQFKAQQLGQTATQQAATLPAPRNLAEAHKQAAQIKSAHNTDVQREQQSNVLSVKQAQRQGTNLNQLVPGFDAALADQHGFYGGLAKGAANVLNDPASAAMLLAAPIGGELLGVPGLLNKAFLAQGAYGLGEGIAHIDPSHDLPEQLGGLIVPGAFTALGLGGEALGAYHAADTLGTAAADHFTGNMLDTHDAQLAGMFYDPARPPAPLPAPSVVPVETPGSPMAKPVPPVADVTPQAAPPAPADVSAPAAVPDELRQPTPAPVPAPIAPDVSAPVNRTTQRMGRVEFDGVPQMPESEPAPEQVSPNGETQIAPSASAPASAEYRLVPNGYGYDLHAPNGEVLTSGSDQGKLLDTIRQHIAQQAKPDASQPASVPDALHRTAADNAQPVAPTDLAPNASQGRTESNSGTFSNGDTSSALPDKAANINLNNLDTPQAVKAEIHRMAQEQAAQIEQSRGKVSQAETLETARQLGLSGEQLKAVTPGQGAAFHLALRNLLTASAEKLKAAADAYQRKPSGDNQAQLQTASAEHATILNAATGHISEAGRTLSSYRIASQAADAGKVAAPVFDPLPADAPPANPASATYGASNKIFTLQAADAARAQLRQSLGSLNSGLDPQLFKSLVTLGGYHAEAGLRSLPQWLGQMRQETGGRVKDDDLRDVWNHLQQQTQSAKPKAGNTPQTPADLARKILSAESRPDADRIADRIGALAPDDVAGLNKIMREESKIPTAQKLVSYWKAGLLSSPKTLVKVWLAHAGSLTVDDVTQLPTSLTDALIATKTGNRTATAPKLADIAQAAYKAASQGTREAVQILRQGEGGAGIQDIGSTQHDLFGDIHVNSKIGNAYINIITRAHGATYRPARLYAFTRAAQQIARLQANIEGLTGAKATARVNDLLDNMPEDMAAQAVEAAEKAVYLNRNQFTDFVQRGRSGLSPAGKAGVDFLLPFSRVGSNIAGRVVEYAGGVPLAVGRGNADARSSSGFDVAAQKRFTQTFGRGMTGAGLMALGAYAASKGDAKGYASHQKDDGIPTVILTTRFGPL